MSLVDLTGLRILLVEDEVFIRRTVKMILRALGAPELREAGDGEAALHELHCGFRPHLILCDVQMEPMDGVSFLKHLRESRDRLLINVPVIMLTAAADKNTVTIVNDLGNCGYLIKPISPKSLSDRITFLFQGRPSRPIGVGVG